MKRSRWPLEFEEQEVYFSPQVSREERNELELEFLSFHPRGCCPRPARPVGIEKRAALVNPAIRYEVCRCFREPYFIKGIPWAAGYDEEWTHLPEVAVRYRAILQRPDLLAPLLHLRTSSEWVRVYPYWPSDLSVFLASPAGRTLTLARSLDLIVRIAGALEALEEHELLHRDLKTSNVLIAAGAAEMCDPAGAEPTARLRVAVADYADVHNRGTEFYAAPELLADRPEPLSVIFSLGLLAHKCLLRKSFQTMARNFGARAGVGVRWADIASAYLVGGRSAYEEALRSLTPNDFRDPARTSAAGRWIEFILAATKGRVEERRHALRRLTGRVIEFRPMRDVAEWLREIPR